MKKPLHTIKVYYKHINDDGGGVISKHLTKMFIEKDLNVLDSQNTLFHEFAHHVLYHLVEDKNLNWEEDFALEIGDICEEILSKYLQQKPAVICEDTFTLDNEVTKDSQNTKGENQARGTV